MKETRHHNIYEVTYSLNCSFDQWPWVDNLLVYQLDQEEEEEERRRRRRTRRRTRILKKQKKRRRWKKKNQLTFCMFILLCVFVLADVFGGRRQFCKICDTKAKDGWGTVIKGLISVSMFSWPWPHMVLTLKSDSHDNWCSGTLLNGIITAQWEGMRNVGSARYELALLSPCTTIRGLSFSNCQRSTHFISKWISEILRV